MYSNGEKRCYQIWSEIPLDEQTSCMPIEEPSWARQLLFSAILGPVVLGVTLGLAELSLCWYFKLKRDGLTRFIHHENKSAGDIEREIDDYLEVRHPVLEWAPKVEGGLDLSDGNALHFDASGSRYSPAFPEPGGACISVYGDSFALGQDVGDEEAWTNQLARLAGCRVANYGMNGYGIDQAVLRAEETTSDEATVTVLSICPSNVLRSLTHQVGFVVTPGTDFRGLKPRFVLGEDGKLTLRPIPYATREQLLHFTNAPVDALDDDWFNPKGYWARLYLVAFPYTRTAWRIVTGHGMRRFIHRMFTGVPIEMDYHQPGHPSGSLELAELGKEAIPWSTRARPLMSI